jgi:hypothetical protein
MPDSDNDAVAMVRKLTEAYGRAKFGRGVVGKTGHAMIGLLIVWGVVVWRISGTWIDAPLVLAGVIATVAFMWWTRSTQQFAERNPAQAMLEGAEFLEYHKFEAQAKGLPPAAANSVLIDDPTGSMPVISTHTVPDRQ